MYPGLQARIRPHQPAIIMAQNEETVTYADPASNKEIAKLAESNCAKEEYTDGESVFPPSSVFESWSAVTTKTVEPKYTICGLTFDLAFKAYGAFPGTSLEEATTANNYLQYVLDTVKEKKATKTTAVRL